MLCIYNTCTDPYLNLATEEYLLKELHEDCFMLWRNAPAIIVGKHQNTNSEINVSYVKENKIKVVRRLTGGGAVFHDLGNLNFTFIMGGKDHNKIDFKRYTLPILEVLQKLGVDARFEGRNDLTIGGKKFSGNAEYLYKERILHHGTLLFSADMPNLSQALNVNPLKYTDKSVKSVRSRVTNISEHLQQPLDIADFTDMLMQHILEMYDDAVRYEFTDDDMQRITALREKKYATWDWNFGASPKYTFRRVTRTERGGNLEIVLDVHEGMIRDAKIYGDYFHKRDIEELEDALRNVEHEKDNIREKLSSYTIDDYLANVSIDELVDAMF